MIKKILLKAKSSFSELFTADQIWGQFVWAISDLFGKAEADKVVSSYLANPPILFSSMMLDGFLPTPQFVNANGDMSRDISKHNKKVRWINYSNFASLQNDPYAFTNIRLDLSPMDKFSITTEIHTSIDRSSLTTFDGGLYNKRYIFCESPLSIYVDIKSNDLKWIEYLEAAIKYWNLIGLGGDKNTGHGQFEISLIDICKQEIEIFNFPKGNSFVSLSRCFGKDLKPISYSIDVYSGIVGRVGSEVNLYRKKPIIQYREGSLFLEGKGIIAKNTGSIEGICSYGLAFPVQVNYLENSVND